ncbi:DinB family protein [Rummeliibacillus pycnus]|uniref:DinB family protein n=1 Tax=Rummeliibacillus pycnus TaxID=101070 RepID=UPI003D2CA45C
MPIKKKLSKEELLKEFEQLVVWVETLKKYSEKNFNLPISKGKWSVAEIISHLMFWDRYILEETLPYMKQNADIKSIEFQELNDKASEYSLSGVTVKTLIDQFIEGRNVLVSKLREKSEEEFSVHFKINGEEVDPYSGYPHTIFNYISSFLWHDNHHKNQVVEFFNNEYSHEHQVK